MTWLRSVQLKQLVFPFINALVFMMLFAAIGYYVSDTLRWTLVGPVIGLGLGLIVEFALGSIGGWIYRRRVIAAVLVEIILFVLVIGPFIYVYVHTTPLHYTVCCLGDSGLGADAEAVRIPVADGETLAGWYAPPADDSGAVVMVLHGIRGNRVGALRHALVLHKAGYGVLIYDQRACGESTGERQSFGLYDRHDITPIMDWLAARPEVDDERIGGVGLSLGAYILIMAAPEEPRLKAIWSDGLGINAGDDLPSYEGLSESFYPFMNRQVMWLRGLYLGEQALPFKQLIPQIAPRPLMLVAGGLNRYETDFNRGYEPFLGENADLWVIENAGHVGGLTANPEVYSTRMIDFFDAALRQ